LHLEDFQVQMNAANEPEQLTCPKGKTGQVQACSSGEGWIAVFGEGCAACDVQHRCPVAKKKRLGGWALHFKREDLQRAERRRRLRQHQEEGRNLRAAVESTIRSIKHGFAGGKAPVRGLFRITCMVVGAAGPWSTFGGCIASGKKKYGLSRGEASKKGGRKNKSEGKSNRKMRLFFLCFEQLGRYNGYRWPYNPFNAQPSVGNVRLSAVESFLFSVNNNPQRILQMILIRYPKTNMRTAVMLVGLYQLCKDEEGIRGFRSTLKTYKPKFNWIRLRNYLRRFEDEILTKPVHGFIKNIQRSLDSFTPFKINEYKN
jgi:hypothetical protein